jgi:hypothetical protein
MPLLTDLAMNPFEDDIVREPRDVTFSVKGLNDNQLKRLIAIFETLETGAPPRRPIRPPKAQLVISPDRGYRKSHLLGRVLRTLGPRATQVYLRPFQDPYKPWHSILLLMIQELERPPEPWNASASPRRAISQLETLALSVLFHLVARLLASGRFPDYDEAAIASAYLSKLAADPSCWSENDQPWIDSVKSIVAEPKRASELASILNEHGVQLDGKEKAWLKVLPACISSATPTQEAALKWFRAEPLEPEEVELLGLANTDNEGRGDSSAQEINDLSFRRLRELCLLASYYRPFLFCFDQTEFFASDPSLVKSFGNCVEKLFAEVQNQMTVITANNANWRDDIIPLIHPPQRDRISPEIRLEGIKAKGATELITSRLREYDVGDMDISRFFADGWLDSVFGEMPEHGVRTVLKRAAERFQLLANVDVPSSTQTIADLFQLQVNDVRSKRALLAYNQDALMWFAKDIAQHQANVSIVRPNRKYFSIEWIWPVRSVYFAFEGGDNSQRWRGIANEVIRIADNRGDRSVLCYVFRTPDLGKVPRSTWNAIGATIKEAARKGLCIFALTLDEVCELHAARELYSNALQGNIAFSAPDTLAWLRTHFDPLLKVLTNRQLPTETRNNGTVIEATISNGVNRKEHANMRNELDAVNLKVLVDTVREMRLVDINVVLSRLGSDTLRDCLLRSVEAHPNLKAHPGPKTTFLQWRIAQ